MIIVALISYLFVCLLCELGEFFRGGNLEIGQVDLKLELTSAQLRMFPKCKGKNQSSKGIQDF